MTSRDHSKLMGAMILLGSLLLVSCQTGKELGPTNAVELPDSAGTPLGRSAWDPPYVPGPTTDLGRRTLTSTMTAMYPVQVGETNHAFGFAVRSASTNRAELIDVCTGEAFALTEETKTIGKYPDIRFDLMDGVVYLGRALRPPGPSLEEAKLKLGVPHAGLGLKLVATWPDRMRAELADLNTGRHFTVGLGGVMPERRRFMVVRIRAGAIHLLEFPEPFPQSYPPVPPNPSPPK